MFECSEGLQVQRVVFSVKRHTVIISVITFYCSTCQACMNVRDAEGKTIMDRLIAKLPDAAMVTLLSLSLSLCLRIIPVN